MGANRRTLVVLGAFALLVLAFAWRQQSAGVDATSAADGRASTAVTTVPAPSTGGVTLPPLPIPEALPDDPNAPTPPFVLGTIEIPRLEVRAELQEGVTLTAINRGPGHWPGTALPGQLGNMVIAGHRTTWTKPFARLDELADGDQVIVTTPQRRYVYAVRGTIVVPAESVGLAEQSYAHTATLFACHPKGQATHRIVAKLRLLNDDGTPADPDDALPPMDVGLRATDSTYVYVDPSQRPSSPPSTGDPLVGADSTDG